MKYALGSGDEARGSVYYMSSVHRHLSSYKQCTQVHWCSLVWLADGL